MEEFARADVRDVLLRFAITSARRATTTDATEEVVLVDERDLERVDVAALTVALMEVLPHVKVWVVADGPRWASESI